MNRLPASLAAAGLALASLIPTGCDVLAEPSSLAYTDPPPAYMSLMSAVNDARAHPRMCGSQSFGAASPVQWNGRLERAAEGHTMDMVMHGYFAHVGSDGSTVGTRVSRVGYDWRRVGENLAHAYRPANEVVQLWLDSPGHCANLMHPGYSEMGVSEHDGYWTQVFGRPR